MESRRGARDGQVEKFRETCEDESSAGVSGPKTFGPVEFGRHVMAELSTATGAPAE